MATAVPSSAPVRVAPGNSGNFTDTSRRAVIAGLALTPVAEISLPDASPGAEFWAAQAEWARWNALAQIWPRPEEEMDAIIENEFRALRALMGLPSPSIAGLHAKMLAIGHDADSRPFEEEDRSLFELLQEDVAQLVAKGEMA